MIRRFFIVAASLTLPLTALASPALAASTVTRIPSSTASSPLTISSSSQFDGLAVTTTLRFSNPGSDANKIASASRSLLTASPYIIVGGGGGQPYQAHCNRLLSFSDSDGTFTYQHACGGSTSPWGYKISAAVQSIIISSVSEQGMSWVRNSVAMPMQSPHVQSKNYQFHGTFNPLRDGDVFSYNDFFTFTVDVAGQTGSGSISIVGYMKQLSTS